MYVRHKNVKLYSATCLGGGSLHPECTVKRHVSIFRSWLLTQQSTCHFLFRWWLKKSDPNRPPIQQPYYSSNRVSIIYKKKGKSISFPSIAYANERTIPLSDLYIHFSLFTAFLTIFFIFRKKELAICEMFYELFSIK